MSMTVEFTRTIGVANSDLFGLSPIEKTENYVVHPMIRNNWRSADRLRDVMGFAPYMLTDEDGSTYVFESPPPGSARQPFEPVDPSAGMQYYQSSGNPQYTVGKLLSSNSPGSHPTMKYDLKFNETDWNEDNTEYVTPGFPIQSVNMQSLLHQELEGTEYEGVPYFVRYFGRNTQNIRSGLYATDERMTGADEDVDPIVTSEYLDDTDIYDHTFEYRRYVQGPAGSPYNIEVNSFYNYYLDTDPDYESFVGQTQVTEALIPNFYMMEITRTDDEGAAGNPYNQELSPGPLSTMLTPRALRGVSHPNSVLNQMISEGYFQYYTGRLGSLNPEELQSLSDSYQSQHRDIAVLTPEIQSGLLEEYNNGILDDRGTTLASNSGLDDILAVTAYPYYNEIIIPYENQFEGPASQIDFYQILQDTAGLTQEEAEKLLTLLQLYACYQYSSSPSMAFNLYDKTASSLGGPIIGQNVDTSLVFHLESMLRQLSSGTLSDLSTLGRGLTEFYDKKSTQILASFDVAAPSFVPLRAMFAGLDSYYFTVPTLDLDGDGTNESGFSTTGAGAFFSATTGIYTILLKVAEAITSITRQMEDYYEGVESGEYAKSDPLMYIVEKRRIPPGQQSADLSAPPVQTFFFGRDYANAAKKGVRYFDTQIKYGVRYQYDIKQLRLVFGNRYQYKVGHTRAILNIPTFGRALGNSLGIFAEQQSLITSTESYQSVIDETGIAPRRLPAYYPPTVPIEDQTPTQGGLQDFSYLDPGDELGPADPNQGYYGYYVYRWNVGTDGNAFRNDRARFYGILTDDPNDPSAALLNAELINLQFMEGEGFDGNYTGGAIAGATMFDGLFESPFDEPPPPDDSFEDEIEVIVPDEPNYEIQDLINEIESILGDEWAAQTAQWAGSRFGALDDLAVILQGVGALPGAGGGVDPRGPAGGAPPPGQFRFGDDLGGGLDPASGRNFGAGGLEMSFGADISENLTNQLSSLGIIPPGVN